MPHADDPSNGFAGTNGGIAETRHEPHGEDCLAEQFQRTAKQRGDGVFHALQSVADDDENRHRRNEWNADAQIQMGV